jgi:hypothetical protein
LHEINELLAPISYHAALGAALVVVVWSAGLAVVELARRALGRPLEPRDALLAYPFGLLAVLIVCFVALLNVLAGVFGVLALAVLCWHGVRRRAAFGAAPSAAASAALRALPFAYGYALVCGFLLHGATNSLDSHALGDNATWVSETISMQRDPIHLRDLTALGFGFPLPETAAPLVNAALDRFFPIDFFLAGAALLPMFLVVSLAAGIGVVRATSPVTLWARLLPASVVSLLVLASIGYPSWIPESPPVAQAAPLVFGLFWLGVASVGLAPFLVVTVALFVCIVLTKIVAAVALLGVVVVRLPRVYGTPSPRKLAWTVLAVLVCAAATVPLFTSAGWLVDFVHVRRPPRPVETIRLLPDLLDVRTFGTLAPVAQLAGILCLFALVIRERNRLLLVPLTLAVAAYWLLSGQSFHMGLYFAFLLVAVDALAREGRRVPRLLVAAALLLGLSAWWFDTAQSRGSFAMSLFVAAGVVSAVARWRVERVAAAGVVCSALTALALAGHLRIAVLGLIATVGLAAWWERPARGRRRVVPAVAFVAALAVGSSAALAVAQSRSEANFGVYDGTIYPRESYSVWRQVAHHAPDDALVFTSQTGGGPGAYEGWNYYPAVGERQVYLAGWTNSPLSARRPELLRRIELNHEVLDGRRLPRSVPGARRFSRYFAVVGRTERHPSHFCRLYANRLFALYAIGEERVISDRQSRCARAPRLGPGGGPRVGLPPR